MQKCYNNKSISNIFAPKEWRNTGVIDVNETFTGHPSLIWRYFPHNYDLVVPVTTGGKYIHRRQPEQHTDQRQQRQQLRQQQ